ncbi:tRNA(Arg) A34 adenosine deaminase TadA [Geosmithia morbida]|uniref:tRNA(Arg) A34 adenosine deaminase TadA n=1 Tax=Geosmithia morbida TaxID=1094350 RepID=A0A9P4Z0C0_9HYPO|nr:tRNA(Arg) A34 adenosine deaminase TadA [Geosmithia morbida]KAF4125817.1 tRNA(Arg) A34 adenosine deaminase TadA [Geosmithia morbida]
MFSRMAAVAVFAVSLLLSAPVASAHQVGGMVVADSTLTINDVPFATRAYWMRKANEALFTVTGSACPFAAFGTVIVNHTASTDGELVCIGANYKSIVGNPTLHGEMAAISNCTKILTDPNGPYNLTAAEAQEAFADLSLYTNAESCPMCASGIQWSGFREYIYGSSIETLIQKGWSQIRIPSIDVFRQSFDLGGSPRLLAEVLTNETDPYFFWQYDPDYACPKGCKRVTGVCSDE